MIRKDLLDFDFKKFKSIQEFYDFTGMNRYQTLDFLLNELINLFECKDEKIGKINERKRNSTIYK